MANIEAERAWMRERAFEAAERRAAAEASEPRAPVYVELSVCRTCGHATHDYMDPPRFWCGEPDCLCAVDPCAGCGVRHKDWSYDDPARGGVCRRCGRREEHVVLAYA